MFFRSLCLYFKLLEFQNIVYCNNLFDIFKEPDDPNKKIDRFMLVDFSYYIFRRQPMETVPLYLILFFWQNVNLDFIIIEVMKFCLFLKLTTNRNISARVDRNLFVYNIAKPRPRVQLNSKLNYISIIICSEKVLRNIFGINHERLS